MLKINFRNREESIQYDMYLASDGLLDLVADDVSKDPIKLKCIKLKEEIDILERELFGEIMRANNPLEKIKLELEPEVVNFFINYEAGA